MRKKQKDKPLIGRRKFLHTSGMAIGAAFMTPVLSLAGYSRLKAGVIVTQSKIYPHLNDNYLAGLQLGLAQSANKDIKLVTISGGFSPESTIQSVRRLIEHEGVSVITGMVGTNIPDAVRQIIKENHVLLISSHFGENIIRQEDMDPCIRHNSFNLWQANWAMGAWAAQNAGKKAVIAASFYESGYDALNAFSLGFEYGGGEILETVVNNLPEEMGSQSDVIGIIKSLNPDLVFASYSGWEASAFIASYARSGLSSNTPLFASAFTVDQHMLKSIQDVPLNIKSCLPWPAEENNDLSRIYRAKTGRAIDAPALLGYQSAQHITKYADQLIIGRSLTYHQDEVMGSKQSGPLALCEVGWKNGHMNTKPLVELTTPDECTIQLVAMQNQLKTGWLNPYLCV